MGLNSYSYVPKQPLIDTFVGLPFDAMLKAGTMKQGQFDKGKQATAMLEDAFLKVNALQVDEQKKNEIIQGYREKIKNKVQETKGDYSQLLPFASDLSNEIKYELSQGSLGAIQKSHDNYQTAKKRFMDLSEKKSFLGQDEIAEYNMLGKSMQDYEKKGGIGERTPQGFNTFSAGSVGPYYDVTEDMSKFWQQMQADQTSWTKDDTTGDFYYKGTTRTVDKNEVKAGVVKLALQDPKYKGQFKDQIDYYDALGGEGYGKEMLGDYLMGLGDALGNREGFKATTKDNTANPFAVQNAKYKLDNPFIALDLNMTAGLYGGLDSKDASTLKDNISKQASSLGTEMSMFFPNNSQLSNEKLTQKIQTEMNAGKSASDILKGFTKKGGILDKVAIGDNGANKLMYLADQLDGLKQRDTEALSYALQGTKYFTAEDYNKYKDAKTSDIPLKFQQDVEDVKAKKDKYLTDTANKITKNQIGTNYIPVYTRDAQGNVTGIDEIGSTQISKTFKDFFKNPANISMLNAHTIDKNGISELPIKLQDVIKGKDAKDLVISDPYVTKGPGMNGEKEVRVSIDGIEYIVPANNFGKTFLNGALNSPEDGLNTMLWNASLSGLQEKKLPLGITLKIPILKDSKEQEGSDQFFNNGDFMLMHASGDKMTGMDAFNYLLKMQAKGLLN